MGRAPPYIAESRTSDQGRKHYGQLSQPAKNKQYKVASPSRKFPVISQEVGVASAGPFCQQGQCPNYKIPFMDTDTGGSGSRFSAVSMATGTLLCLSTTETHPVVSKEGTGSGNRGHSGGSSLATTPMVPRHNPTNSGTRAENSSQTRPSNSGTHTPSLSRAVPIKSLGVERQALAKRGYSAKILDTLLASKKPSTCRTYSVSWRKF